MRKRRGGLKADRVAVTVREGVTSAVWLWRAAFGKTPEETGLSPETQAAIGKLLIFGDG